MKNQVKITATKGKLTNTAATAKDAILPAIPLKDHAPVPNSAFEEVKAEDLNFTVENTPVVVEEPKKEAEVISTALTAEPTKLEIKEDLKSNKPALSLEQTLLLVKDLAERTAHRATYIGYIDNLNDFVISQNDDDMGKKDDPSFKGCELTIRDGQGNVFLTKSASVIFGTVEFMKSRFNERLSEVEAEIVIPV